MTSIVKKTLQSIEQLSKADLLNADVAQELVAAAAEISAQKKQVDEQDKTVKDNLKRMFADEMDAEQNVAVYNWDIGMKMTLTARGGSIEIDDMELMKAIFAHYGEDLGNRDGLAWQAFCAVTDPVECPRTINPDKLAAALDAANLAADAKHAATTPEINEGMVKAATVVKKPNYAAGCSAISKAELAAHEDGELTDTVVVKGR